MDLMIVHPVMVNQHICPEVRDLPYPNTFLSFRSHVDGFFIMSKAPDAEHSDGFQEFMKTNPEFLVLRVMSSFLYWTLQRLGIWRVQRYLLCYSVSRAFEETFQIDSAAVMATIATRIGATS